MISKRGCRRQGTHMFLLLPPWRTMWRTMSPFSEEVLPLSMVVESVLLTAKGPLVRHLERQLAQ